MAAKLLNFVFCILVLHTHVHVYVNDKEIRGFHPLPVFFFNYHFISWLSLVEWFFPRPSLKWMFFLPRDAAVSK